MRRKPSKVSKKGMSIKEHVIHVLTNHPETRENDTLLEFMVCERLGFKLTPEQWVMVKENKVPKMETIRRHRAKIQNVDGQWQEKRFI